MHPVLFKSYLNKNKIKVKVSNLHYHGHNTEINKFIVDSLKEKDHLSYPITLYKIHSSGIFNKIVVYYSS